MDPAVRQILDRPLKHLQRVKEIAAILPADDAELDGWIAEVIESGDGWALTYLLIAAVGSDRAVDARHLTQGAMLLGDPGLVGCLAWRMTGDVPEAMLRLVRETQFVAYHATALFVVAAICEERRNGVFPPELLTEARVLARHAKNDLARAGALGIAAITRDPALAGILKLETDQLWEGAEKVSRGIKAIYTQHPFDAVVPERERNLAEGFTLRRAVARVGRNDPCPCQSGRKYKHCCMAKDEERLRDSSHVAGKSQVELRVEPEAGLTLAGLKRTSLQELLRIDPTKVAEELHQELIFRLAGSMHFQRAVDCMEALGFPERLDEVCLSYAMFAARAERKDALELLLKRHPRAEEVRKEMFLGARLLLGEDDPASIAPLLEEEALLALKEEDPDAVMIYARGLLTSKYLALGILAGRSAIAHVSDHRAAQHLLTEMLMARDRLNLSPEDIASELLEKRWLAAAEKKEREEGTEAASALAEARERLETKAREVERLQQALKNLRTDVEEREKRREPAEPGGEAKPTAPGTAGATAGPTQPLVDEEKLSELRFKVEELKATLKERHEERVRLRQELREAYGKLDSRASTDGEDEEETKRQESENDAESKHLLPEEALDIQPLRLPEFPANFRATLEQFPRHVARSAMAMIGRLASGEAAAFHGVVRLKVCPGVYRQRIGRDHRLLFRLLSGRLVVLDLINRRDLERRIKGLG